MGPGQDTNGENIRKIRLGKDTCNKDAGESFLNRRKLQKSPDSRRIQALWFASEFGLQPTRTTMKTKTNIQEGFIWAIENFVGGKGDGEIWV